MILSVGGGLRLETHRTALMVGVLTRVVWLESVTEFWTSKTCWVVFLLETFRVMHSLTGNLLTKKDMFYAGRL